MAYHEVDSSEMAFKICGSIAFKEAMRKADPVLTEPIMKVVTIVPTIISEMLSEVSTAAAVKFSRWILSQVRRKLPLWFRFPKCSGMQPISVL